MIQTLRLLLQRVREAGLRLQLKKCTRFSKKITWLGFDISSEGVQIPEKLKKELLQEKPPLTPASLANWLGRLLYFRQHILGLSHFSARLHEAAARPPKDWKLSRVELEDFFMLRRAFLESTAVGFVDYDNLDQNKIKVFLDWSCLGISALATQTQKISKDGRETDKEVLVGSISRKCPPSLRNATSCRGEAAALTLALSAFANILQNRHFLLHTDHLSLLYLKGLKNMNGQLWRLFEEIAKYSFTMIHVRHRDNGLADAHSRRTNLPELTKEEAELFGSIIEELQENDRNKEEAGESKALQENPERRKKGEPRQRGVMTEEQEQHAKKQQLKQIHYAKLLNQGFPLRQEQAEGVEEVEDVQGGLTLGPQGARHHHRGQPRGGVPDTNLLHCIKECQHESGWLPSANGKTEKVCVSRRGAENCGDADNWTSRGVGELDEEEEEPLADENPLLKAVGGKLRGHIADCISPEEVVEKQKNDPILGKVYHFVQKGVWPNMKTMREQFFHPEVIKLFNLKEVLELDDLGMMCRRRTSPEEGRELKVCLPLSLREVVFQTCHLADTIHRGVEATVKAISDRFFYLHMNSDLRARILRCGACYTAKLPGPKANARVPELHSTLLQSCCEFNHTVAADTSGRLPACKHNPPHKYFALIVDTATGFVVTVPMADKTGASMAHTFLQSWVSSFHAPAFARFDRGSEFVNKSFLSMLESNGIQPIFTMVGAARALYAERKNRDVKQTLRAVLATSQDQSSWCLALPYITASLNAAINQGSGFSAYRLVFGKDASTPLSN